GMSKQSERKYKNRPQRGGGMGHGPGAMHGEKPKEFKKTLWRLLTYLKPRRFQLIIVAIAAAFSTLFNVITPKLLGNATTSIFDSFTSGTGVDFTYLKNLLFLLLGLYVISSLFAYIQQYMM